MMSTEPSDSVSETELGKSEFKGSDLRQDDTRDDPQQQIPAPLGVELRRYRRLTTGVILGLAMPKAVYLYKGEGPILTTLDLVVGIILAFLLYWLGVIEAQHPELSSRFFQADPAPPILKILRRPEVHLWHFSVLSLIRSTIQLKATLDGRLSNAIAGMSVYQARNRLVLVVLPFSTAIVIFCVQCLRFAWPGRFEGLAHHPLVIFICSAMYYGYIAMTFVNQCCTISFIEMLPQYAVSMLPLLLPVLRPLSGHRKRLPFLLRHYDLFMSAYVVLTEALIICFWWFWGLPEF